ncbi:MAG: sulfite exporter TauE/SafE family protein [Polyangiales bacterium]
MWPALIAGAAAGLASIPHCTVMCGPLSAYACSGCSPVSGQARYQLGRFISYSALGAVVGAAGGAAAVALPGSWGSALLSWSLALGLGVAAFRLWRRPRTRLVQVTTKPIPRRAEFERPGFVAALGRHPFGVGLATALLPCGALAAAVLIAASTGSAAGGAMSMLAFSVVSGAGLIVVSWVFERMARRPMPAASRTLAVVLALGAVVFVLRPMHAHEHATDHGARHTHDAHQGAPP